MPHEQKSKQKLCKIGNYTVQGLTLGKGNFARVELATHDTVGYPVALKVIDTETIREDYVIRNLEREAVILTNMEHPNIVMLYETIRCNKLYCLALEYVKGCDLGEYINSQKNRKVPESAARRLFYQLVSAVRHMHHRKILHRDLKLENIMIQADGKVKLVDFGLSNFYDPNKPLRTRCGSPEYAAPELFSNTVVYGASVDLWSLGVILYAMGIGVLPFRYPRNEASTLTGRRQLLLEKISKGLGVTHKEQMKHVSPECQQLLERLLEPNQNFRINMHEVVNHSWFTADCSLPDSLAKPPRQVVNQASEKALQRLSVLLGTSVDKLEKKIKEKSHDRTYAMYHLLRTNLEKEFLSSNMKEQELARSDCSENTSCLQENKSASKTSKLAKDDEISSVENSIAGSSHINAKGLSRMDMGLSKILYLDKINSSAPVNQDQHSPQSSKNLHDVTESVQPKLEETPHFTAKQEKTLSKFDDEILKKLESTNIGSPPKLRKEEVIGDRQSSEVKEGSQKINTSRLGLRSERSRTKLKEEFYMEDIRSLERIGCKPSDIRKLSDIKKFSSHARVKNFETDKEAETGRTTFPFPHLQVPVSKKYPQKNSEKKSILRNRDLPNSPLSPLSCHDNYGYSSSASSCASGRVSFAGVKPEGVNPSRTGVFKSTSRPSERIHQDTLSSTLKKSYRAKLPVQRSENIKATPPSQMSRTMSRSPALGGTDAQPRLNSSKVSFKRAGAKNTSNTSSFTSNRSMKSTASNVSTSRHFNQQKSYEINRNPTPRKENLRTFHGAPMTFGTKCRSNEVTSKAAQKSPIMSRARSSQSGPEASSSIPKSTPSPFASGVRKTTSEKATKFFPALSTSRESGASIGSIDVLDSRDLPFPTKPIIHTRQSPRIFLPRLYKKS